MKAILVLALGLYYYEPTPDPVALPMVWEFQFDAIGNPRSWRGKPWRPTRFWNDQGTDMCDDPACLQCNKIVYPEKKR